MIKRQITSKLLLSLSDSPFVVIQGARQTGKSTLVKYLSEEKYPATYMTFDDLTILSAAQSNSLDLIIEI
ncbi:Hypothetical protein IALB_3188 [Ignavibacterium album JCM 16511]|uniref:AAA domain-containing protein n=1 Tax=Ignavibacterium album (strain DSM 19864 / JCM 16511 / NBRC 101810 / Mat9-16) TaxID=945713 RepID=I0API4_IGNAJ|nr:AAA family ATPase [Ignavibacterium album]AFH50891.1 Hypothetical protein IALB_3188 [Ignavibacterium album JCM 16511]